MYMYCICSLLGRYVQHYLHDTLHMYAPLQPILGSRPCGSRLQKGKVPVQRAMCRPDQLSLPAGSCESRCPPALSFGALPVMFSLPTLGLPTLGLRRCYGRHTVSIQSTIILNMRLVPPVPLVRLLLSYVSIIGVTSLPCPTIPLIKRHAFLLIASPFPGIFSYSSSIPMLLSSYTPPSFSC
jgi:hypothetical protein